MEINFCEEGCCPSTIPALLLSGALRRKENLRGLPEHNCGKRKSPENPSVVIAYLRTFPHK